MSSDDRAWLDKRALATHLGCSIRWIEQRQALGLPHAVIAGRCKYRVSEVEPWLEAKGYLERRGDPAERGAQGPPGPCANDPAHEGGRST